MSDQPACSATKAKVVSTRKSPCCSEAKAQTVAAPKQADCTEKADG